MEKALGLLEFLANSDRSRSLQDITQAVNLPKPTAYRLLQTRQQLGYVSRPPDSRSYRVGVRAARLSGSDPFSALKAAARPLLVRLHERHNETVNPGVLSGANIVYLDFLDTTQSLRFIVAPGHSSPYYSTALGRAIASGLPEKARDRLVAVTRFQTFTPNTVKTGKELRSHILKAAKRGYAEEIEESVVGVCCFAVSLAARGFPDAAISVAVPTQRLEPRRKTALIKDLKALVLG